MVLSTFPSLDLCFGRLSRLHSKPSRTVRWSCLAIPIRNFASGRTNLRVPLSCRIMQSTLPCDSPGSELSGDGTVTHNSHAADLCGNSLSAARIGASRNPVTVARSGLSEFEKQLAPPHLNLLSLQTKDLRASCALAAVRSWLLMATCSSWQEAIHTFRVLPA